MTMITPRSPTMATPTTIQIEVFSCQPFESRQGIDTVVGLRFPYSPPTITLIKQTLARFRPEYVALGGQPGGWAPKDKYWWVERRVWPTVQAVLEDAGCVFTGEPHDEPNAAAWPDL
jgi:hypothetical protein